jgi:hypothetical protein
MLCMNMASYIATNMKFSCLASETFFNFKHPLFLNHSESHLWVLIFLTGNNFRYMLLKLRWITLYVYPGHISLLLSRMEYSISHSLTECGGGVLGTLALCLGVLSSSIGSQTNLSTWGFFGFPYALLWCLKLGKNSFLPHPSKFIIR